MASDNAADLLRVLHVVAEMGTGGAERVILHLARHGEGRVHTTVTGADGEWSGRLAEHGAEFRALPANGSPRWQLRTLQRLREVITAEAPDVVHVHNIRMSGYVRLATLGLKGCPPIFTTMHGVPPESEATAVKILRACRWPVVNCAPQMVEVMAGHGLPESRQHVVINGGHLRRPEPTEIDECAERFDLDRSRPIFLGLGRLVEQKAWHRLIEAAALVPDAQVVVAGDGELADELARLVDETDSPLRFIGRVSDPAPLVALADAMVFPSNWEGLPIAAIEALSVGVPVVCTRASRIADAVDSPAVIQVPADTGAGLAEVLSQLAYDPELVAKLRSEAQTAGDSLSTEAMANNYFDYYRSLTPGPKR